MQLISQIDLPSPEEVLSYHGPNEDDQADSKLLQKVPWLIEKGNLTLVWSWQFGSMEKFLYYLIASVAKGCPVRCLLRRQRKEDFLRGLIRSFSGLSFRDRIRLETGQISADDRSVLCHSIEERIRSLDLGVEEIIGLSIEDVLEHYDSCRGESLSDAVVVIDSLSSLTSKATDKWDISRTVIGARIRDWSDFGCRSVVLLDRMPFGMFYYDMYGSINEYLDGQISILPSGRHWIGKMMYEERTLHLNYRCLGSSWTLYYDPQTGRYIDELPPLEPQPETSAPAPADLPF